MIKNNKNSLNNSLNIIELELEREKTKQLELIKEIKKMELRILLNEKYKKNKNRTDVFKMFNSLNSDSEYSDTNSLDSSDFESNNETISMCSNDSEDEYKEVEIIIE
jgi:hypothetical protein